MRHSLPFVLFAGALLLLLLPISPANAASAVGTSDYAKATRLLTAGKDFNRAITLLEAAVRAQPNNSDYHLALGCANADRAASLSYADMWQLQYAQDKANYSEQLRQWKAELKTDPSAWVPEKPPASFHAYTKDDRKPFTLTHGQAQKRINRLKQAANREFAAAVSLSKTKKEKAKAEYTEGWAILVDGTFSPEWTPQSGGKPGARKAIEEFQAATRDDPANASYWESLGYFESDHEAVAAYEHAIALQLDNAPLLYTLYLAYHQSFPLGDLLNALSKSGPVHGFAPSAGASQARALVFLTKAISADPRNAYLLYELAGIEMQSSRYINNRYNSADTYTPGQKKQVDVQLSKSITNQDVAQAKYALRLINQGNQRRSCYWPRFQPPVPTLLKVPWTYGGIVNSMAAADQIPSNAALRGLARDGTRGLGRGRRAERKFVFGRESRPIGYRDGPKDDGHLARQRCDAIQWRSHPISDCGWSG